MGTSSLEQSSETALGQELGQGLVQAPELELELGQGQGLALELELVQVPEQGLALEPGQVPERGLALEPGQVLEPGQELEQELAPGQCSPGLHTSSNGSTGASASLGSTGTHPGSSRALRPCSSRRRPAEFRRRDHHRRLCMGS